MANKKDVLQIIDEINEIKKHLVPLNKIIDKNEKHLYLYHNKNIKDMNDQQVLNYSNISQSLFPVLDELLEYMDLISDLTAKEKMFQATKEHFIINSKITSNLKKISNTEITGPNVILYKRNANIYTYIDELKFKLNDLKIEKDGQDLAIEPIVYIFNTYDKSIRKFDEQFSFNINCTQEIIIVGIKLKEKVNIGETLKIYRDFSMDVYYNDLTINKHKLKLYKTSNDDEEEYDTYLSGTDLEFGDIPFFSIIDIFGNHVDVKYKEDNTYCNLQKDTTVNSDPNIKRIKMLRTNNDYKMNISLVDNFIAIQGKSFFYQPETIKFYVYMSPETQATIYFPSLAKLTLKLQRVINAL